MPEKIREMLRQASALLAQAVAAMEEGNVEESEAFELESDELKTKAASLQRIHDKQQDLIVPVMPTTLPGDDNGTMVTPPKPDNPVEDNKKAVFKSIYNMRYGDTPAGVKTILHDLYGPDYEELRFSQAEGFNLYMRLKDHMLTKKHWEASRQIILTPEYAMKALESGQDVSRLKATMVEAADILGGFIVPVDFQSRVLERLAGLTVMRGRAQEETTSRDTVQFPLASGGDDQFTSAIREKFVNETPLSTASETNATFDLESIQVHTAMGLIPLSKNLLEDAAFNLVNYLIRQFSNAAAINEDNTFLIGTGTGKPQGILPGSLNALGLEEQNSGAAGTLTFDGILRLLFKIGSQYKNNALFVAARDTYRVISELKDGSGAYLWTEFRGNNAVGLPDTLRGFPVLEQEAMPAIGANTFPILFGSLEGYMIVDRIGMSVQRFDVNPGENIVKYEMRRRFGGQVVEPWRLAVQKVAVFV